MFSAVNAGKHGNRLKSTHRMLATQSFLPGILPHNNQPISKEHGPQRIPGRVVWYWRYGGRPFHRGGSMGILARLLQHPEKCHRSRNKGPCHLKGAVTLHFAINSSPPFLTILHVRSMENHEMRPCYSPLLKVPPCACCTPPTQLRRYWFVGSRCIDEVRSLLPFQIQLSIAIFHFDFRYLKNKCNNPP